MKLLSSQFQDLLIVPRPGDDTFNMLVQTVMPDHSTGFVIIDITTIMPLKILPATKRSPHYIEVPEIVNQYYKHILDPQIVELPAIPGTDLWVRLLEGQFRPLLSPPVMNTFDSLTIQLQDLQNILFIVLGKLLFIVKYEYVINLQSAIHTYEFKSNEEIYLDINSANNTVTIWAADLLG